MQAASHWYELEAGEVLRQLGSDTSQGLSAAAVSQRLIQYGFNDLKEQSSKSIWRIVWRQMTATMVPLLIGAAYVSLALRDYEDAAAIAVIVLFNAILGMQQEYQVERAIALQPSHI